MTTVTPTSCLRIAEAVVETPENYQLRRELIAALAELVGHHRREGVPAMNDEPSYLAFARANVRDALSSSPTIVRELLARIDLDAKRIDLLKTQESQP